MGSRVEGDGRKCFLENNLPWLKGAVLVGSEAFLRNRLARLKGCTDSYRLKGMKQVVVCARVEDGLILC